MSLMERLREQHEKSLAKMRESREEMKKAMGDVKEGFKEIGEAAKITKAELKEHTKNLKGELKEAGEEWKEIKKEIKSHAENLKGELKEVKDEFVESIKKDCPQCGSADTKKQRQYSLGLFLLAILVMIFGSMIIGIFGFILGCLIMIIPGWQRLRSSLTQKYKCKTCGYVWITK